jgi:hypothetical protein
MNETIIISKYMVCNQTKEIFRIPRDKKYKRTVANHINHIWQIDLIHYKDLNVPWVLSCIDVFSRKGCFKKMMNKKAKTTLKAFKEIIK